MVIICTTCFDTENFALCLRNVGNDCHSCTEFGSASCLSVLNRSSSRLLCKNENIKLFRTVILFCLNVKQNGRAEQNGCAEQNGRAEHVLVAVCSLLLEVPPSTYRCHHMK